MSFAILLIVGVLVLLLVTRNDLSIRINELTGRIEVLHARILELERAQRSHGTAETPQAEAATPAPQVHQEELEPKPEQPEAPPPAPAPPVAAPVPLADTPQPLPQREAAKRPISTYIPANNVERESVFARLFGGRSVEDVIGENLLAIIGGLFVIVGAIFFLTLAIHNGWIGETGRVALVFAGGSALFGTGLWLAQRQPTTSRSDNRGFAFGTLHGVVAGTGTTVLFLGAVVGTRMYDVLPPSVGLLIALAIGAVATAVAVRWESQDLAAFGIIGALASPILVDAPPTTLTLAFLTIALVSAVAVVVTERWPWLLSAAFIITIPQLAQWANDFVPYDGSRESVVVASIVLIAYWLIMLAGALGHELRDPTLKLRTSSASVVFATAGGIVLIVQEMLERTQLVHDMRPTWLIGFAALHLIVGAAILAVRRPCQTIAVFVIGIGAALLAAGAADLLDGPLLTVWWVAEGVALSWLYWLTRDLRAGVMTIALGALAAVHAIAVDAPPSAIIDGLDDVSSGVIALTALIVGPLIAWWLSPASDALGAVARRVTTFASALFGVYLASLLTVTFMTGDFIRRNDKVLFDSEAQFALVVLWSVAALVAAALGSRFARREFSTLGVALGCFAPLFMVIIDNSRGLDVVAWLAATAIAAGWLARKYDDEYALAIALWATASTALHVLIIEAPLFDVLSLGATDLARATAGIVIAGGTSLGIAQLIRTRDIGRTQNGLLCVRSLDVLAGAMSFVLASTLTVTLLTSEAARTAYASFVPFTHVDETAQLVASIVWGAMALAYGYFATRRDAEHIAWLACTGALLAVAKTLTVGPSDDVVATLFLAVQGVGFTWLVWNARQIRVLAYALPAGVTAGALALLTIVNAPPDILLYGTSTPGEATLFAACAVLLALGVARVTMRVPLGEEARTKVLRMSVVATAVSAVYAVSIATVGFLTETPGTIAQDAQLALSIVWGVLGVAALGYGARQSVRHIREIRIGAFILLGLAVTKVVVFDTSQLEATYRVLVFVGLGLLLLGGAYVDQRLRQQGDDE